MTTQTEALKLALMAHKKNERHNTAAETRYWCEQYKLLAEQALAQPEQEPVAIVDANDEGYWAEILPDRSVKVGQYLYAEAPQRKEPEQEPVAWIDEFGNTTFNKERGITPLYTTPQRTWVGLTDEEIDVAIKAAKKVDTGYAGWVRDQRKEYAKAIEAKLKEKNNA